MQLSRNDHQDQPGTTGVPVPLATLVVQIQTELHTLVARDAQLKSRIRNIRRVLRGLETFPNSRVQMAPLEGSPVTGNHLAPHSNESARPQQDN